MRPYVNDSLWGPKRERGGKNIFKQKSKNADISIRTRSYSSLNVLIIITIIFYSSLESDRQTE